MVVPTVDRISVTRSHQLTTTTKLTLILLAVLAWRLSVAVFAAPILHEDQTFQYIEPAHRIVYGYGFVPWEYRFGLRNWLLPGFLAVMLTAFRSIGIDQPTIYMPLLQCLGAILSMIVVYSAYVIGKRLHSAQAGLLAAVLTGTWHELSTFAVGLIPEVLAMNCAMAALALWPQARNAKLALAFGVLIGLCAVLRLQYAPVSGVLLLLLAYRHGLPAAGFAAGAAASVVVAAGALDQMFWGTPFASFYNNFLFNFVYDVASLFGERTVIYYFGALAMHSIFLFAFAGIYALWHWRQFIPILLIVAAVLIPHSLIGHKEYRFVVLAIPLLLIVVACAVCDAQRAYARNDNGFPAVRYVGRGLAAVFLAFAVYKGQWNREPRLDVALYLSEQPGVKSILDLAEGRWRSGGYSYLHKDIPLMFSDDMSAAMKADVRKVASHIVINASKPPIAGFKTIKQFGLIKIMSQTDPPLGYKPPRVGYRNPPQPGVDGKFVPNVTPWPSNVVKLKDNRWTP